MLYLSLIEDGCFLDLWNETVLQILKDFMLPK
jgi:hypothetical protein